ncbi:hypothetical protein [Bacteroides sp. 519]|uniref:hypothetical protein n=1 Tax=Bacteroides sp. 519 TaxID=2302937 RepID=UPI0013D80D61|nr:hypothetical protein [Bacteroides sp. 519]NDV58712.1 hypothetical protein [Bacteroides sp. 519]
MRYKHYIVLSLLLFIFSNKSSACGPEYYPRPSEYNLFKIIPEEKFDSSTQNADDNILLWYSYVQKKVDASEISQAVYKTSSEEIQHLYEQFEDLRKEPDEIGNQFFSYLIQTNDKEVIRYLLLAKQCEEARFRRLDAWYYPSKEDLEFTDLKEIYKEALLHKESKLRSRYLLQAMRAAYSMFAYEDCISLWENEIRYLPQDAITMMSTAYVGSIYFQEKEYEKAAIIYSMSDDIQSLKWCISNLENPTTPLETIELVYKYMPHYTGFAEMVAPLINRAEKTTVNRWTTEEYWSWYEKNDYEIQRKNYQQLTRFALRVVREKRNPDLAYWQSVASYLTFLDGDYHKANDMLMKAERLKGEIPTQNNIRVLRILYDAVLGKYNRQFDKNLLPQLQWLYQMAEKTPFLENRIYNYRNRYTDVLERLIDYHWVPGYQKKGNTNRVCGLIGLKTEIRSKHFEHREEKADTSKWYWNNDYSSSIFCHLDTIPLQQVIDYQKYIFEKPKTALDQFIAKQCYKDPAIYNDLIATKYIRMAEFEKAVPYLEKLSNEFLSRQNIINYLVKKDSSTDIWLYSYTSFNERYEFDRKQSIETYDYKLRFCRQTIQFKHLISTCQNPAIKASLAYQYATVLANASYYGKLWAITHYGKGELYGGGENGPLESSKQLDVLDSVAVKYFRLAEELAETPDIKAKSIYAQACLSKDPCLSYDWVDGKWQVKTNWQSEQCGLFNKLIVNSYQEEFGYFIRTCDRLQDYSYELSRFW